MVQPVVYAGIVNAVKFIFSFILKSRPHLLWPVFYTLNGGEFLNKIMPCYFMAKRAINPAAQKPISPLVQAPVLWQVGLHRPPLIAHWQRQQLKPKATARGQSTAQVSIS